MKSINYKNFRHTVICSAMAICITIPGAANAGFFDQVQNVKTKVTQKVAQVKQKTPAVNAVNNMKLKAADLKILEQIKEFQLKERLKETITLYRHVQADYQYFSGGSGCAAQCAVFKDDLRNLLENYLSLAQEIPVLSTNNHLINNLMRLIGIVDVIPPRALYALWQILDGQLNEFHQYADGIRYELLNLPFLEDNTSMSGDMTGSTLSNNTGGSTNRPICDWIDNKPLVDLFQARLEMISWRLKSIEGLIPDVESKAAGGASVGAQGEVGLGMKITDQPKIMLKAIAYIPERINWLIKINMLRAKVVCKVTE